MLGRVMRDLGIEDRMRVISKLSPELDHLDPDILTRAVRTSLGRLGIRRFYGLMLHREELLDLWNRGLGSILTGFVTAGLTERVGGIGLHTESRPGCPCYRGAGHYPDTLERIGPTF